MRDIKFRGKRVDNEEWIVGSLVKRHDGRIYILDKDDRQLLIISGTEGQYTCVKDNNGNEIYHKDIFVLSDRVGEVEWERDRWVVQFKDYNVSLFDFIFNDKGRTVSGNIYENPDLIK